MSIFDGETQTTNQGNNQPPAEDQGGWLDKVVADKGEKFRDPEELAKSLFNANMHIKTLEEEAAQGREAKTREEFGKELLDQLRSQPPASREATQTEQNNTGGTNDNTSQLGPEDIKKLVDEAVTNREHTRTREQNISEADKVMRDRFGDQAQAELSKRAKELGVEVEYLADVAAKSPTAFMRMIGEAPQQQTNSTVESSANTVSLTRNSGKRDWAYYKDLMKKNPKQYRSRAIQDQMERDYAEQGNAFWG